jgi:hypothetical protein
MKKINKILSVLSLLLIFGAFNAGANSQDSVTRWEPVSNSIMSFGRMTMLENRNSAKVTWKKGQSSPFRTISESGGVKVIYLTAAPKFDGVVCRYIKITRDTDHVTLDFYSTKKDLQEGNLVMEGAYEQIK